MKAASTVPEEPTVTGTPYAGVQPDVTYDVPGHRDTSAVLAAQLGDLGPALEPLAPGLTLIDSPTYTLERLPAIARWQAFNPERTPECMGILTDPLTVTGTWEKAASWPGNQLFLRVMQFADEDTAAEAYATLSLEQGVKAGECTGFAEPFGADDHDAIDVVHRIPPLSLPPGTRYNSWLAPPPPAMPMFTSVLADRGPGGRCGGDRGVGHRRSGPVDGGHVVPAGRDGQPAVGLSPSVVPLSSRCTAGTTRDR